MEALRLIRGNTYRGLSAYEAAERHAAEAERRRLINAALQDMPPPRPLTDTQALVLIFGAFAFGMALTYILMLGR